MKKNMIYKYSYGEPICTEAVIRDVPLCNDTLVYLKRIEGEKEQFAYTLGKNDVVYGLGENVRGINKRGGIYESNCSDEGQHLEDKKSLYGAHNFLVIHGVNLFGIFVDDPGAVRFDVGNTDPNQLVISSEMGNLFLYIIEGQTIREIVKIFRSMIGQSYIPPKWAFGYGQSRWSYINKDEIREVVANYRENKIPLDMVYLDIDYMDNYKDFTINKQTYPEFSEFVEELREQGIHLVPIIDAGVKVEKGYDVYEQGIAKDYFCKDSNGNDFVAAVWPGKVHFPDVMNKEAREWFGDKYRYLLEQGIEGFWNDMNEPAIFYSEEHLKEVLDETHQSELSTSDIQSFFKFQSLVKELSNNMDDYKRFYHNFDGKKIRHDQVHNLYGYNMTRAASESFEKTIPDKRILIFSRSSYIGMHRYGGIWTGDNMSWWQHLLLNIKMMPSLNMCGFLYAGADIGGFAGNTTEDLMLRWMEFGVFTPLMRNHSTIDSRRQELYLFEKKEVFRNIIDIRYSLLPYIYSEFVKDAVNNEMYFRPLSFDYQEDYIASQIEDQLMVGDSLMIAPVYQENATGRYVYLPEQMKMYRLKNIQDMNIEILEKGHHYISVAIDELLIFLRPNSLCPLCYGAQCVEKLNENDLLVLANTDKLSSYTLYQDNGKSKDFENPSHYSIITIKENGNYSITGNKNIKIRQII